MSPGYLLKRKLPSIVECTIGKILFLTFFVECVSIFSPLSEYG